MLQVIIQNQNIRELVTKALIRSFSRAQISTLHTSQSILICDELPARTLASKIIVLGKRPFQQQRVNTIANIISASKDAVPEIFFFNHELTQNIYLKTRSFERFDFAREWNNLGYGKTETNPHSPWGIAEPHALESPYLQVLDETHRSILWVNRNVGPIDGFDWRIIEDFISDYRSKPSILGEALTCLPVLSEVPAHFTGAITMRIDCDENIESGRPLFELYQKNGFPFSMAIKTKQTITEASVRLMREVIKQGGAITTHSHTHAPNWGGSEKNAFDEVSVSLGILKEFLPEYETTYAVSPFHQNPPESVLGIEQAGIDAFVGGIIQNDPEYLMARSGEVPFVSRIISHSEQCMFHGDSYHAAQNSIHIYLDALKSALKTETFFGYLDHPFSNYQYGWLDEEERLKVHAEFLSFIKTLPQVWFASLSETLDFLWDRAQTQIRLEDGALKVSLSQYPRSMKKLKVRLKGEELILG